MLLHGSKWDVEQIAWDGWQFTVGISVIVISVFSQREQFFALPTLGISKNLSWRVLTLHPGTVAGLFVSMEVTSDAPPLKKTESSTKPSLHLHLCSQWRNSDPTTCCLTAGSGSRIQLVRKRLQRSRSLLKRSQVQEIRGQLSLGDQIWLISRQNV